MRRQGIHLPTFPQPPGLSTGPRSGSLRGHPVPRLAANGRWLATSSPPRVRPLRPCAHRARQGPRCRALRRQGRLPQRCRLPALASCRPPSSRDHHDTGRRAGATCPPGRVDTLGPGARTDRAVHPLLVDHLPTAPVVRASVDTALRLTSYEATVGLVNAVVNGGYVTAHQLGLELILAPTRGSGLLRRALTELGYGTRSVAEVAARELFHQGGMPEPEITSPSESTGASTSLTSVGASSSWRSTRRSPISWRRGRGT